MNRLIAFVFTTAIAIFGWTALADAKECKSQPIVVDGKMTFTKIAAIPHSLLAWRKAARSKYGAAYQAWGRSDDRTLDCNKVRNDAGKKRWQCTRSARPCARDGQSPAYPGHVLRRGASGDDVETLQRLLTEAGFEVETDGDFGRKTRAAIKAFQKAESITVDGIVGRETWERLVG